MLFRNTSIDTLVCLSCGESLHPNEVAIEKVGDLKVPAKIKAAGTLFQMLACPKCQSPHLGFIPVKTIGSNVATPRTQLFVGDVECESDSIVVDQNVVPITVDSGVVGLTVDAPKEPKKVEKINKSINEDDFANMRKPKKRRGPPAVKKIKCTSCGKMKDVGPGYAGGDFGTKCDSCLKGALNNRKGQ